VSLPPTVSPFDQKEAILAREVYERAVFLSIDERNFEDFENSIAVVKTYYDLFRGKLPVSEKEHSVVGLYLLYLLAFNK